MKLSIYSPERTLLQESEVSELKMTTSEGEIEILPGHQSMLGTLELGEFEYLSPEGERVGGFISTGFYEVSEDRIELMAEVLELAREIDTERAKQSQGKAEQELMKDLDMHEFNLYQLKLQRALIRQQLAEKHQSG